MRSPADPEVGIWSAGAGEELLFVEVGLEVLFGDLADRDSGFGDLGVSDPSHGVEDGLSQFGFSPIVVEMGSGEAESTGAIFIFGDPHEVLGFLVGAP